jgi:hypothetical protein
VSYVLHILTHGRRYTEDYDTFEEALTAARALEHEPRERAEAISSAGKVCADRERIEALIRELDAGP